MVVVAEEKQEEEEEEEEWRQCHPAWGVAVAVAAAVATCSFWMTHQPWCPGGTLLTPSWRRICGRGRTQTKTESVRAGSIVGYFVVNEN